MNFKNTIASTALIISALLSLFFSQGRRGYFGSKRPIVVLSTTKIHRGRCYDHRRRLRR